MLACFLLVFLLLAPIAVAVVARAEEAQVVYIDETVDFRHTPNDPAYLSVADGKLIIRLGVKSRLNATRVLLGSGGIGVEMRKQFTTGGWDYWYAALSFNGQPLSYYFVVETGTGCTIYLLKNRGEREFYFDGKDPFPQVPWVRRSVTYQIFPERFWNGDPSNDKLALESDYLNYCQVCGSAKPVLSNWGDPPTSLHCCHQYYGGDLKGIIEKLDYLKELGVGLIYLNPIFASGSAHGYDTCDYYKVDPKFGTEEDLRVLLDEAHKRGIRVIFDFVPDHVGVCFEPFLDVYRNGRNSSYWSWFIVYKWPFSLGDGSAYKGWWGLGSLPQLNVLNNEVKKYLINVALYWLEFGFDGLRIDTPLDVIDNWNFFRQLRQAVKERFPEAYIVGEIWENRPDWTRGDTFDSLMNYYLGRTILLPYARGATSGEVTAMLMADYYLGIGVNVAGMNFNIITSHDTSRLLTELGAGPLGSQPTPLHVKMLKMLTTIQYTLPGTPVVYMGDERGYTGDKNRYDEQRYPILWDVYNPEILEHYKQLGALKNLVEPLYTSIIRILPTEGSLLAYTRGYGDEILVVANNDKVNRAVFEIPFGTWRIIFVSHSSEEVVLQGRELTIPPLTAVVLERADTQEPPTTVNIPMPEDLVETTQTTQSATTSTATTGEPSGENAPSIDTRVFIYAVSAIAIGAMGALALYSLRNRFKRK